MQWAIDSNPMSCSRTHSGSKPHRSGSNGCSAMWYIYCKQPLQNLNLSLALFRYWTLNDVHPDKWMPFQNPLPSDCSKRLDLQTLLSGDIVAAQDMKIELENLQRSDAKIRKAAGSVG